ARRRGQDQFVRAHRPRSRPRGSRRANHPHELRATAAPPHACRVYPPGVLTHMSRDMTAILYPVAASADEALSAPRARAAREREASRAAGEPVAFTTEAAGPAFATREAALDAYRGLIDDERSGFTPAPEE